MGKGGGESDLGDASGFAGFSQEASIETPQPHPL